MPQYRIVSGETYLVTADSPEQAVEWWGEWYEQTGKVSDDTVTIEYNAWTGVIPE
jgi:hypothetical protein